MSGNRTHYPYLCAGSWRKSGLALIVSATGAPSESVNSKRINQHPGLRALQMLLLLIFFFWGYIKGRVFVYPVSDVEEVKAKMQAAVYTITEDMLKNTTLTGIIA